MPNPMLVLVCALSLEQMLNLMVDEVLGQAWGCLALDVDLAGIWVCEP